MVAKLDSQNWRDQFDQLRGRFQKLYEERGDDLQNYENTVNTSLSDLIGETLPAAKQYFDEARDLGDVVSKDYAPAVSEYIQNARDYDTPEKRAMARQGAMTDVMTAGDAARKAAMDRLESYGIDPSVTRSASLDQNARLQTALEAVRQGRQAGLDVEERGQQYLSSALQAGAQAGGLGLSAGQTGAGMLQSATQTANQVGSTWANIWGTPAQNLEAQKGLIESSLNAKATEVASKQAAQGAKGSIAGALGQTVGMVAGGAAGYFGSGGNPMGAMYGAQTGGELGGQAARGY